MAPATAAGGRRARSPRCEKENPIGNAHGLQAATVTAY